MTPSTMLTSRAIHCFRRRAAVLVAALMLAACGGGGGGDGGGGNDGGDDGGGNDVAGDDARRAVLADIGENVILPALRDFADEADALQTAVDAHAAAPMDAAARTAAQDAWRTAMTSWQYAEVLQVGPAGLSSGLDMTPGGLDLRSYIYAFPLLSPCTIEELASQDVAVTPGSAIDTTGLGALELLLFSEQADPDCDVSPAPTTEQRAAYAASAADRILTVANDLVDRWEPSGEDFLAEWSTAGDGSTVYATPQEALDALSVALFYVEKDTKDDKIADPTGLGATGLTPCPTVSCPERLESPLSDHSGDNIRANMQAFLDVFTGVDGGMGMNDLLTGIDRDDLADQITAEMQAALDHMPDVTPDFDTAVADISSEQECVNATANPEGVGPTPCELHGFLARAMDTFRGPIVGALSLATPNRAQGDND